MCWKETIQWQSATNGLRKAHVLRPPFLDKVLHHIFFLMVICNSLLLLKSLPINIINCIHFWTRYYIIFFFLMVICNSLLLLKSLPINIISRIKSYADCSALTMIGNKNKIFVCLFVYMQIISHDTLR